jgi:hypothetical protein
VTALIGLEGDRIRARRLGPLNIPSSRRGENPIRVNRSAAIPLRESRRGVIRCLPAGSTTRALMSADSDHPRAMIDGFAGLKGERGALSTPHTGIDALDQMALVETPT